MSLKSREEIEKEIVQKTGKDAEEISRLVNEKLALFPIRDRAAASMVAGDLGIPIEQRFDKGKLPSLRGKEAVKVSIEDVLSDPDKYEKANLRFEGYIINIRKFDYGDNKEKEAIAFGLLDPTGYMSGVGFQSVAVSHFNGIEDGDTIAIDGAGTSTTEDSDQVGINVWASCFVEKLETPKGWKTLVELRDIYMTRTLEEVYDGDEGIITVFVVSFVGTRPYFGCPECFVGIKKGEICKVHNLEPVELFWNTLFVGDESMESGIMLPPGISANLPEMGYYDGESLVGKTLKCYVWFSDKRGLQLRKIISITGSGDEEPGPQPTGGVPCPQCEKEFPTGEALSAHILIAHPKKEEKKEGIEVKTLEEPKEEPEEEPEPSAEEEQPSIDVSEKDYKVAKDLVNFLVPTDLATVKSELENMVEGDAMTLLKKMKDDKFIEIKGGQVRRV